MATNDLTADRDREVAVKKSSSGKASLLQRYAGVAVLVALIDSAGGNLLSGLQHGWWFALGAGLGASALAFSLPAHAKAPAADAAPAAA